MNTYMHTGVCILALIGRTCLEQRRTLEPPTARQETPYQPAGAGKRKSWVKLEMLPFFYAGGRTFALVCSRCVKGGQLPRHDKMKYMYVKLTKSAVLPDMSAAADMETLPSLKIAPPEQRSDGDNNRGKSGGGVCNLQSRRIKFQRIRVFHGFGGLM